MSLQYTYEHEHNYAPGGICIGICKSYKSTNGMCTCTDHFPATIKKMTTERTKVICEVLLNQIEDNYSLTTEGAMKYYDEFKHGILMDKNKACGKHQCKCVRVCIQVENERM
jgi:hypothetical protein